MTATVDLRLLVLLTATSSFISTVFNDAIEALRMSYRKMNPFCVPFATTNMGSAMLAMDLGWMGPNYSISTACATSNFCILNAANHIIRGEADVMLCGGSDAVIIPIGLGGFVACRALSQRNTKTKFKKVLTSLSEEVEESGQLAQLTELCELLSFCSDSSLSSPMVDSFSPVLVQLARHNTNSDIMLLAIRAINLGKVCSGNITVEEAISVQVKNELNQSFMPHRLNLL